MNNMNKITRLDLSQNYLRLLSSILGVDMNILVESASNFSKKELLNQFNEVNESLDTLIPKLDIRKLVLKTTLNAMALGKTMQVIENPKIMETISVINSTDEETFMIAELVNVSIIMMEGGIGVYQYGLGNTEVFTDKDLINGFITAIVGLFAQESLFPFNSIIMEDSLNRHERLYYIYSAENVIISASLNKNLFEEMTKKEFKAKYKDLDYEIAKEVHKYLGIEGVKSVCEKIASSLEEYAFVE